LLAGSGLAAAIAIVLRSMPGAETISEIVHVLDPVAYAGTVVIIVVACAAAGLVPALRAARIDPMTSLRQQ
jgi:ABC-type antimicrobial peptide transport system permease subunit